MSDLSKAPTKDLVEELKKREGVDSIQVEPYVSYEISVKENPPIKAEGPAIILNIID